ncbi:hypothetical protein PR003_g2972 [Phytophthora rubi]|uniref:Uncharacterized protein n=1 Tax=Phytophthora rubi TaxID=129364 RepID=A0A6A3NIZ8_9STRA|nr:hypothetical protein PR002_g2815 [Phytophthora rubi]KAE9049949.1 hypothetical protein PR001_g2834 [Phytophthora rubi]KAE9355164.1 hypothetical protein PR003_g2972 [Phytophthora rubi]
MADVPVQAARSRPSPAVFVLCARRVLHVSLLFYFLLHCASRCPHNVHVSTPRAARINSFLLQVFNHSNALRRVELQLQREISTRCRQLGVAAVAYGSPRGAQLRSPCHRHDNPRAAERACKDPN